MTQAGALGSPVGGGAWSSFAGGPSNSVKIGFRRIRPDLIALERGMQLVAGVIMPSNSLPSAIRQLVVDVQIADLLAVGETGQDCALILLIVGITAMLSLRGKMPVRMIVGVGRFRLHDVAGWPECPW